MYVGISVENIIPVSTHTIRDILSRRPNVHKINDHNLNLCVVFLAGRGGRRGETGKKERCKKYQKSGKEGYQNQEVYQLQVCVCVCV